jgi:hypothetical protein
VVLTILKNISQWEGLSHILWKIKNVPNHQPVYIYYIYSKFSCNIRYDGYHSFETKKTGTSAARPYREAHRATAFFQAGDRIKGHLYGNLFNDLIGKSRKLMENQGKSWKIKENHGKSRKIMETHGKSWKIYLGTSMVAFVVQ